MLKFPQFRLVQIFIDHLVTVYTNIQAAQDDSSDEGSKVTRQEIWIVLANFICDLGQDLENAFLKRNSLSPVSGLRWKMIRALLLELSKLPDELEEARSEESAGGKTITKMEAIRIIREVVTNAAPKIINAAQNDIK